MRCRCWATGPVFTMNTICGSGPVPQPAVVCWRMHGTLAKMTHSGWGVPVGAKKLWGHPGDGDFTMDADGQLKTRAPGSSMAGSRSVKTTC